MNACQIGGVIESIESAGHSKLLVVRYGKRIDLRSDASVHNVNQVLVRVPPSLLKGSHQDSIEKIGVGNKVVIYARVQGVLRRSHSRQGLSTEIVASRITRPEYEDEDDLQSAAAA